MMKKITAAAATGALALSGLVLAGSPASADAPQARPGKTSLAEVLAADGAKYDKNWKDFDVLDAAVTAVLTAKPDSPVAVLANGKKRVTAFLPTDNAFRNLVGGLKGFKPKNERKTFKQVAKLGPDTIEAVLLYHVVVGQTLTSGKVLAAEGAKIPTALGPTIKVHVSKKGVVTLIDKDPDARNPVAIPSLLDINKGNKQIGHGIDRVLRPLDL